MSPRPPIDSIYFKYYHLDSRAWHQKVNFYEANIKAFNALGYRERIEVELDYCLALFEVGKYKRYLEVADRMIEIVIEDNIYTYAGLDIYKELLFKKAACLFNLRRFQESNFITRQLIKMDRKNKLFKQLLSRSYYHMHPKWYNRNCALAVLCFLAAMVLFILQLFVVEPFYQMYVKDLLLARNLLFMTGAVILFLNEAIHRLRVVTAEK